MARTFGSIISAEEMIKRSNLDFDDAVRRYRRGESAEEIGRSIGINPSKLRTIFRRSGIKLRTASQVMAVRMQRLGRKGRQAVTAAAHTANRGRGKSKSEIRRICTKRANAMEINLRAVGRYERRLAKMLAARGLFPIPQKAVGHYNIDIAIFPVAVEVMTSTNYPTRLPHHKKRLKQLLKRGWWIVYVRITKSRPILTGLCADEIVSFFQKAERNPSVRGKYRVIWGTGERSPLQGG